MLNYREQTELFTCAFWLHSVAKNIIGILDISIVFLNKFWVITVTEMNYYKEHIIKLTITNSYADQFINISWRVREVFKPRPSLWP
jgi:phage terminase Nu1 subunit (DNA packaging protein)